MKDLVCAKQFASQTLPDELVYHILHYTSPRELIRLCLVSKQFNNVARDTQLWKALYATARLPRPPGPFSWQSTRSLERILVPSERLSSTWVSQPPKVVSVTHRPRHRGIHTPNILFGRLFIWSGGKQVLAEDLEMGCRQIICQETDQLIDSFKIFSRGFPDALRVYLVVSCINELRPVEERIKVIVFSMQDETSSFGPVIHEMDLPEDARFSDLAAYRSPLYFESDFDFGHQRMIVDPRTYNLYRFPPFHSDLLHGYTDPEDTPLEVLITGPYIVVMWNTWRFQLVQIFIVPTQPHPVDGDLELRLTHQARVVGNDPFPIHSLRDPVVNSLTGDTVLRFLAIYSSHYFCVDFTFPAMASNSTEVLSLTVTSQNHIFEFQGTEGNIQLQASSDGYVRGLYILKSTSSWSQPIATVYKFSIDASGEECTAMVSDALDIGSASSSIAFDGVRGRICYRRHERKDNSIDLVVFDFLA